MGQQIIRQPDGRLALFSSIVEGFTVTDATPAEMADYLMAQAAERAHREALWQIQAVLEGDAKRVYHQFTMDWEEALALHWENFGDQK